MRRTFTPKHMLHVMFNVSLKDVVRVPTQQPPSYPSPPPHPLSLSLSLSLSHTHTHTHTHTVGRSLENIGYDIIAIAIANSSPRFFPTRQRSPQVHSLHLPSPPHSNPSSSSAPPLLIERHLSHLLQLPLDQRCPACSACVHMCVRAYVRGVCVCVCVCVCVRERERERERERVACFRTEKGTPLKPMATTESR